MTRAVILAAGLSTRMGAQKLLLQFRGRRMIEYAIDAAREYSPLVVASPEVAAALQSYGCDVIVNDDPARGMAHSLKLANAAIESGSSLIVMLADKPFITAGVIRRIGDAAESADVTYPVSASGEPGHPVFFSPAARARIPALPDGDSIRYLRDDPSLARRTVRVDETGPFFDVDTIDDVER